MTIKISKLQATDLIKSSQGKFINVKFTKKNGEDRSLTGRTGVHKYITGEGLKYNPDDYGLVNIYDNQKKQYRMVNLNTLRELTIQGTTHEVE
tara:strand:+ start:881 stop:1159 length:279 start_codon:yes stop_codon:yes gene_type:complete